jgi:hypothetical protein
LRSCQSMRSVTLSGKKHGSDPLLMILIRTLVENSTEISKAVGSGTPYAGMNRWEHYYD